MAAPNNEDIIENKESPSRYRMALTAWLEKGPRADYGYISGYKKAADILVKDLENGSHKQDFLVYPMFFLYRHHCELSLKRIVRKSSELLDKPISKKLNEKLLGHSVGLLWGSARGLLNQIEPLPADMMKDIQAAIDLVTELDSHSFAFRYSTTREGEPSLRDAPDTVQIERIAKVFNQASPWFFAAFDQINFMLDLKSDMLGDLKDAMNHYSGYEK